MVKRLIAFFVTIVLCVSAVAADAKRSAPPEVPPVVYQGIKYSAPPWGVFAGRKQNGGYVEARDPATDKLLWELKIYQTQYNPVLEGDVQDIFITSLELTNGYLRIKNEKHDIFLVDLNAQKVVEGAGRIYHWTEEGQVDGTMVLLMCVGVTILIAGLFGMSLLRRKFQSKVTN